MLHGFPDCRLCCGGYIARLGAADLVHGRSRFLLKILFNGLSVVDGRPRSVSNVVRAKPRAPGALRLDEIDAASGEAGVTEVQRLEEVAPPCIAAIQYTDMNTTFWPWIAPWSDDCNVHWPWNGLWPRSGLWPSAAISSAAGGSTAGKVSCQAGLERS